MDREVIHDDWTGERNSDVLGVYEWKGHSFFFVHFAPPPALKNPLPPAGSVWGYGSGDPGWSRALERGLSAVA